MARFSTKDEDGNSVHSSDEEPDGFEYPSEEKESKKKSSVEKSKSKKKEKAKDVDSDDSVSVSDDSKSNKDGDSDEDSSEVSGVARGNPRLTSKIIKRVNTQRFLDLGVPGGYEKFNYADAII